MSKEGFRDEQISHLIADELDIVFSGAADEELSELQVSRVEHAQGGSHFLVLVEPRDGSTSFNSAADIKRVLHRADKYLRWDLTSALNMKRSPQISIQPDPLYVMAKWGK